MKRRIKISSIFVRNFLVIAFLMFLVFGVITAVYSHRMKENARNEVLDSNYQELKRSSEMLDSVIEQLVNCAYYISQSDEWKILKVANGIYDGQESILELSKRLRDYERMLEYVDSIFVYTESLDYVVSNTGKKGKKIWKIRAGWNCMRNVRSRTEGRFV